VEIAGQTGFVSAAGTGQVIVGCTADTACRVRTTLAVGSTTIAHTGLEGIGARELGYVIFSVTAAGKAMLARARGNQLAAKLTVSDGSDTASGQIALVRFR